MDEVKEQFDRIVREALDELQGCLAVISRQVGEDYMPLESAIRQRHLQRYFTIATLIDRLRALQAEGGLPPLLSDTKEDDTKPGGE